MADQGFQLMLSGDTIDDLLQLDCDVYQHFVSTD